MLFAALYACPTLAEVVRIAGKCIYFRSYLLCASKLTAYIGAANAWYSSCTTPLT